MKGKDIPAHSDTKIYLSKLIYNLEDLLTFIESYFSKYFDLDQKIPDAYVQLEKTSFLEKVEEINSLALGNEIDPKLIGIILNPVQNFITAASEKDITFRRLIYLKQLLKDLRLLLSSSSVKNIFSELFNLLVYLNFNSRSLVCYATNYISEDIRDQTSFAGQIERLSHWLKTLNQSYIKPGLELKNNRPSFQDQVSTWLTEEIRHIEKKKQLTLMLPPSEPVDEETIKVATVLSVPQLAFTIRLLREVGIFTNKNQTELIRFFSRNFSSLKNESISPDSLRVKYYNIEKSTVTSVQVFLAKMIEQSKKTRWLILYATTDLLTDLLLDCTLTLEIL